MSSEINKTSHPVSNSSASHFFAKYDVPVPRYTSYPTVPYWERTPSQDEWIGHIKKTLNQDSTSWSMYIHIPFCETLCTFCGCNNIITKDHKREEPYRDLLLKEWSIYLNQIPELKSRPIRHIHLGGGSPSFFSAENLKFLLSEILKDLIREPGFEGSIEVDPRRTNKEQLQTLKELGFNRVSLGVQDFDSEVQRLVNRHQPFEITKNISDVSRQLGYASVNFDLIYGLAKQTPESILKTAEMTVSLRPDRIALYSFAMVPWIKPQQRLFKDEDLPTGEEKRKLYEIARNVLLNAGYLEVGMDHFALPTDELVQAMQSHTLHRNFMGYTNQRTDVMLGLGVSSISETPFSFHQNEKLLPKYEEALNKGQLPTLRGHVHSSEDLIRREQILKFMTDSKVEFEDNEQKQKAQEFLKEMIQDGLVQVQDNRLMITDLGRPFLRNACVFFDEHLKNKAPQTKIFSSSI